MTLLLAHPEAEDLGQFVEGTLDDAERAAIVQHIADCDDCRILVVDAAEFIEPAKTESHRSWVGIAASLVLVAAIGAFMYNHFHDPLADVEKAYAHMSNRPMAARLGGFPYVPHVTNRGVEEDKDPAAMVLEYKAIEAADVRGSDAKSLHTRGIGLLLGDNDAKPSIAPLQAAAERDPNNAQYQSDLAAALIAAARGDAPTLERALAACDRALRIDPRSPDALFNRAVALQELDRPDALAAYERYLAIDPSSRWAGEARQHIEGLRPLP